MGSERASLRTVPARATSTRLARCVAEACEGELGASGQQVSQREPALPVTECAHGRLTTSTSSEVRGAKIITNASVIDLVLEGLNFVTG